MTLYKPTIEVEANLGVKVKAEPNHLVLFTIASTVANHTTEETVLPMGKGAKSVEKKIISKQFARVVVVGDHSKPRGKKGKHNKFHEVSESGEGVMGNLVEQVQSLFYNDVHFNSVNLRMHITLHCTTPDGQSSDQTFKVDTGADGNLMPISMFSKVFPKVSLDALSQTINKSVTLFAYKDTEIKQFGTCSVRLSFQKRSQVCKFFMVEHETAIIGITDSEKLGLVSVNFDMVQNEKHVKIIGEVKDEEESFKQTIEREYPGLFKGIGLMDGEISIKLKDGAVPHVVAH